MSTLDTDTTPALLVCYASSEGQTERIARRMADVLSSAGAHVTLADVSEPLPSLDVGEFDGVILGASVHAGSHQRSATRFVRANRSALEAVPSAFFSVSLTAAYDDPEERAPADEILEEFLESTDWNPDETATIPGALAYSKYGRLKRLLMRFIAGRAGKDTDTSRDHEYTDWEDVERFARSFATQVA